METSLIQCVNLRDANGLAALLAKGANATKITFNGRSAIGHAAYQGYADMLDILLKSCSSKAIPKGRNNSNGEEDDDDSDGQSEPKKMKTPDGMDGMLWDEEIPSDVVAHNDEGSKLYIYYAQMIEKTGDLLSNTICAKDPHCLDEFNHAPIHYAVMRGHIKCVELLLDHGCPVNLANNSGVTSLHLAVNHIRIMRILLAHGADPNKKTFHRSELPLHRAVLGQSIRVVELLLDAGSHINATCTSVDQTPLMMAASINNTDIANILVERGAQVNAIDANGGTALYHAVVTQNRWLVERLLLHGARCQVHNYLLHYCARRNWEDILRVLIAYDKESIHIRDQNGWTPLYIAISERYASIVRLLLDHGAQLNCQEMFREGMHLIIQNSESRESIWPTAYILLQNGVDIDMFNYWGETPLLQAIMLEKYRIAEFLVKEGADLNMGSEEHCPDCLPLVRRAENVNLMRILINAGMYFHCIESRDLKLRPGQREIENYLAETYKRPLSLQQLSRIAIRNRLIDHVKRTAAHKQENPSAVVQHLDGSLMKHCVSQTGLPRRLQAYVYDFTDLPMVHD